MKKLGEKLNIGIKLTTYVARHTMAMQLQGKNVPREGYQPSNGSYQY